MSQFIWIDGINIGQSLLTDRIDKPEAKTTQNQPFSQLICSRGLSFLTGFYRRCFLPPQLSAPILQFTTPPPTPGHSGTVKATPPPILQPTKKEEFYKGHTSKLKGESTNQTESCLWAERQQDNTKTPQSSVLGKGSDVPLRFPHRKFQKTHFIIWDGFSFVFSGYLKSRPCSCLWSPQWTTCCPVLRENYPGTNVGCYCLPLRGGQPRTGWSKASFIFFCKLLQVGCSPGENIPLLKMYQNQNENP